MKRQIEKRVKRTQREYSLAFKLQVVEEIEKGELTSYQSRKKYGIQGNSTVLVWLRKYGTLDWNLPNQRILKLNKEKTPEQRIKELEAALEEEKLKSKLLDTIINIAEKQYGFNIRKKSSPKQQSNSSKQK